jgi:hypothetical protein
LQFTQTHLPNHQSQRAVSPGGSLERPESDEEEEDADDIEEIVESSGDSGGDTDGDTDESSGEVEGEGEEEEEGDATDDSADGAGEEEQEDSEETDDEGDESDNNVETTKATVRFNWAKAAKRHHQQAFVRSTKLREYVAGITEDANKLFRSGRVEEAQNSWNSLKAETRNLNKSLEDLACKADFCMIMHHHMMKTPATRFATMIQLPDDIQQTSLAAQSLTTELQALGLGGLLNPTLIATAQADNKRPPSQITTYERYEKVFASQWPAIKSCLPKSLSSYIPKDNFPEEGKFTPENMNDNFPRLIRAIHNNYEPWIPRYRPIIGTPRPRPTETWSTQRGQKQSQSTQSSGSRPPPHSNQSAQSQHTRNNSGAPCTQARERYHSTGQSQSQSTGQRQGQEYSHFSPRR